MTRRRWIADQVTGNQAALTGAHAAHLSRVLRARIGQEFDIVADGVLRRGKISSLQEDHVEFELGEEIPARAVSQITLLLSIFKFDRMEWAIEKCTELGVAALIPVVAQRTESHLAAAAVKRVERWQRIAQQAAEQSRRLAPPEIPPPMKLKDAMALPGATRIVLSEQEETNTVKDALSAAPAAQGILLAFGPEGGWTAAELEAFQKSSWVPASLGSTILRAETAAIAATAIALAELGF